jgi:hypothetical protein
MGTILDGLKAKYELVKAVKGSFRIFARLDSVTAIRLQQILEADRESEALHLRSIITSSLSWQRWTIRKNMRLYALKTEAIHAIVQGATSCEEEERVAGAVFRWLRHNFETAEFGVQLRILDIASGWKRPSPFMSLTFSELRGIGVADVLANIPESTDRLIEVINQNSNSWWHKGDIDLPDGLLAAVACIPDHLKRSENSY